MTTTQDCPLTHQAVGWALHALEPDEEMAVLLHLPQCARCRAAAHDAEQVLAGLGGAVEQVDPPSGLRNRLMAAVANTPQRPPTLLPRPVEPVPEAPAEPSRRHRLDAEQPAPPSRRSLLGARAGRGRRLVAASLAVVAAVSLGGLIVTNSQLQQQRDAGAVQARSLSQLVEQLDRPGSRLALLADPESGATLAALVVTGRERQVYPVALPANSDNTIYVAWGINAGADPVPLDAFDITAADQGVRTLGSAAKADDFSGYAISIEPGRVAPVSPSEVVASGQVAI